MTVSHAQRIENYQDKTPCPEGMHTKLNKTRMQMFVPQKYERTGLRRKMNCTELSSGKISWERWPLRWSFKEGKKFSGHSWDLYSLGCISIVKTWGQETLGAWDTQEDMSEEPHSSRTQGPWGRTARSRMERECRAPWSVVSSKSPHAVWILGADCFPFSLSPFLVFLPSFSCSLLWASRDLLCE